MFDALFGLPPVSTAVLPWTSTVTTPSTSGVIVNVYVSPSTAVKFDRLPLLTNTPADDKPVTGSLTGGHETAAVFVEPMPPLLRTTCRRKIDVRSRSACC